MTTMQTIEIFVSLKRVFGMKSAIMGRRHERGLWVWRWGVCMHWDSYQKCLEGDNQKVIKSHKPKKDRQHNIEYNLTDLRKAI